MRKKVENNQKQIKNPQKLYNFAQDIFIQVHYNLNPTATFYSI